MDKPEEIITQPKKVKYHTVDVTNPTSYSTVYKEHYWLCEDGDPTRALFFNQTAQCNRDMRICNWIVNGAYKAHDNIQIVFMELAYVPQQ